MKAYAVDLHVHLGSSLQGDPVKITASPRLTITGIINGGMQEKGLDVVGIVDAASPYVLEDIEFLLYRRHLEELKDGGLLTRDGALLILGSEVEVKVGSGVAHFLAFFPTLSSIGQYSQILAQSMKNINLSSQLTSLKVYELYHLVEDLDGILFPAHAFTPFKSIYGSSSSLYDIFPDFPEKIPFIELGLSADTFMASHLKELAEITFLSNSDAHSLEKMGREFNLIQMENLSFNHLLEALSGDGLVANYGLDPRLGKYHRTYCLECCSSFPKHPPPLLGCPFGHDQIVMGVLDRVLELGQGTPSLKRRPPYHYQFPLEFIPGLGKKGRSNLYQRFGSEREILHDIQEEHLKEVIGSNLAKKIIKARKGDFSLISGGGGFYGRLEDGS